LTYKRWGNPDVEMPIAREAQQELALARDANFSSARTNERGAHINRAFSQRDGFGVIEVERATSVYVVVVYGASGRGQPKRREGV